MTPIGERQLTWDHPQAEVDTRAMSNLAGKLSRASISVHFALLIASCRLCRLEAIGGAHHR